MREFTYKPVEAMEIDKMELEPDSRDDIPQLIKGLHSIFVTPLNFSVSAVRNGLQDYQILVSKKSKFMPRLSIVKSTQSLVRWARRTSRVI